MARFDDLIYDLKNFYEQETVTIVLIFILIFALVYTVLKKIEIFKENNAVTAIVSLIVSVLATFYLSEQEIVAILLSYNALGFILTFLLPFVIVLILLHKSNVPSNSRKIGWIIFGAILGYFWYTTQQDIQGILMWGAIGIVILAIALDESLHKAFKKKP